MIAVSVDYRLKVRDNVEVPVECVKDAKASIRFLRKNAERLKVNPNLIVAAGGSAGGQMAAAVAMIGDPNDTTANRWVSCVPNAVILYNPYFKCQADMSPPNFIKANLPPFITFLGDQDPAIKVEELNTFHEGFKALGNASEYYVVPGGKHGLCNGRNPYNPFFYWSRELEHHFFVKHGILTGPSNVKRPAGVAPVGSIEAKQSAAPAVAQSEMFLRLDVDNSGFVSLDEYVDQFMQAVKSRDANKDGSLSPEEFPFPAFKTGDLNNDGRLTMDEATEIYKTQFGWVDKNQDGVITPDEL